MGEKIARMRLVADGLRRIQEFESANYLDEYADHLTQPAQAVDVGAIERSDVWVVQDEAGHPIHCAGWPQACREHIREAINEHGIEEARAWKVLHYTNGATA